MTTDFSLMDIMGNLTGGPAVPDETSTSTSQIVAGTDIGAGAGRGFVNPKYALSSTPVVPKETTMPASVAPISANYNTSIAQQESGGRADIGFHNKEKSTAFGPYGMTAGAYEDARKRNPSLPVDITQATPTQLTEAQTAFTDANAGYLKNYGIPVNDNTLSAAHFLGAKGLSDYLKTGVISPQAAAANGGEANVRRIVDSRLGGQAAPASGAVSPTVTSPLPTEAAPVSPEQATAPEAYTGGGLKIGGKTQEQLQQEQNFNTILNSNSQEGISKLAFDINTPVDVQRAAFDKLYQTNVFEDNMRKAREIANKVQENPTPAALNKAMNDKDTGSYFKVLLFQALGWTSKAKQELDKLNPSFDYTNMMVDGTPYMVKVNSSNGLIDNAWSGGKPVDLSTLNALREQGVTPKQMGNVKEVVKVGDKTIGVFSNGSMIDLATRQPYTGSLAGAEKLTGTSVEGAETGLVDPTTKRGGYSRAYEGNKLVTRDASGAVVTDPNLISRLIKVGVGGETPEQKAETKRVEAALERLTKDIPNPTEEQKIKALRDRSVPDSRIEQELGLTPGSLLARKTQVTAPAQTNVVNSQANVQAANTVQRVQTAPAAVQTDVYGTPPTIREGESKSEFDKRAADFEARRKPLIKNAEAYAERQSEVRSQLNTLQRGIDAVGSGAVNLGPTLSPSSPLPGFQQAVGSLFGTDESQNTNVVKSLMTREGLQGIKNAMGPSISNFDVEQWLKSNPIKETSTLPEIKKYLEKLQQTLYETAEYSRKNAEALGYRTEPLPTPTGTQGGEIRIIKREKIQ